MRKWVKIRKEDQKTERIIKETKVLISVISKNIKKLQNKRKRRSQSQNN